MKHKNIHRQASPYTLVELMIAMAILVIMMGFLFQFLNSAQRLWSVTASTEDSFDQAHLCFELLEKDLIGAIVQDEATNPGRGLGYHLDNTKYDDTANNIFLLGLVTQVESNLPLDKETGSEAFPVVYFAKQNTNPATNLVSLSLYRAVIDTTQLGINPSEVYGDPTTVFSGVTAAISSLTPDSSMLLCDNIASIKLSMHPPSVGSVDSFELPQLVKVSLELFDSSVKDTTAPTRVFSKVIMLTSSF